jgi:hypothetical protein
LLAALPVEAWRDGAPDEALGTAAGWLGLTRAEAEALRLGAPVRRLGRALRNFTDGFSWAAAIPFEVKLGIAAVHGRFDLSLTGAPGEAVVSLVPGGRAESPASLGVLLQALRARAGEGRQVRAALFAVDGDQERLHWASHPPAAPEEVEARVRAAFAAGTTLAERLERRGCEALGCGFVRRCHPSDRGL